MHELPLVFFTVLIEASIGLVVFASLLLVTKKIEPAVLQKYLIIAGLFAAIGLVASITHLGQPLRAMNSLLRVGSSPMSNEIFSTAIYCSLLFATLFATFFLADKKGLLKIGAIAASIAGVLVIVAITTVYKIDTVPVWNHSSTTVGMFATALVVGGVLSAIYGSQSTLIKIGVFLGILLSLAAIPMTLQVVPTISVISEQVINLWMIKGGLLLLGFGAFIVATVKPSTHYCIVASIAVILAELAGRAAFYDLWSVAL